MRLALLLLLAPFAFACAQETPVPTAQDCVPPDAAFTTAGWQTDFCERIVDLASIRSGGPPRDGIPPLDAPAFVPAVEAEAWLSDAEPVIVLELGGAVAIYPLQILTWHEIVNDTVGGTPVAVTYCPLCNAAVAFERPALSSEGGDGERLTFGTTGNLRHSDLVMWDRQTETWWQQFTGTAIVGELTGMQLTILPTALVSWAKARAAHPDAPVLSRDTGFDRPYGRNPYVGYDDEARDPFLYDGEVGPQLPAMARIAGVIISDDDAAQNDDGEAARAYAFRDLAEVRVVNDALGGEPLLVVWQPGTASALNAEALADSRDVGATGVFRRTVATPGGLQALTFEATPDGIRDVETGSIWTLFGEAVTGPLAGQQLDRIAHHDVFWFVWSAFQPDGDLWRPAR
ncbi:MAG: DUF3179 domain-containing protein [Bacteroidota bacterium]